MNRNRQAVTNFLNAPLHVKCSIAKTFGASIEGIGTMTDSEMFRAVLAKATVDNKVMEFVTACLDIKTD